MGRLAVMAKEAMLYRRCGAVEGPGEREWYRVVDRETEARCDNHVQE